MVDVNNADNHLQYLRNIRVMKGYDISMIQTLRFFGENDKYE